jgi:hypothetical protein
MKRLLSFCDQNNMKKSLDKKKKKAWKKVSKPKDVKAVKKSSKKTVRKKVKKPAKKRAISKYEKRKERERKNRNREAAAGQEIGEIPAVVHPGIRKKSRRDLRYFAEKHFPERFTLAWSDDHLTVIKDIETTVLRGGLFAEAMPRGTGKTTIVEVAILWAALFGHHAFIAPVGATKAHAEEILESVKVEIETNEQLAENFPEVCYPVSLGAASSNKWRGQKCGGKRTRITWKADVVVLPTVDGSAASGVIIKVSGLTGRIRGLKHPRADGVQARPTLAIIDDPQTDKSAASATQTDKREKLVAGAVLGLAGPGQRIAAIMPCTVIQKGDLADRMLDRETHPEWNGVRTQMVYAWPTDEKLWEQYAEIRADGLRRGDDGRAATEFYRERRELMDEGSVVAWEERFDPSEISALQHAVNLRLRNEEVFFAEYQNDPIDITADSEFLTADQIADKLNHLKRLQIPAECDKLLMFIDVHAQVHYYKLLAVDQRFNGYLVDYGTWPKQTAKYFAHRSVRNTNRDAFPKAGKTGAILAGLKALVAAVGQKTYRRDDGVEMRPSLVLLDSGWEPDTVFKFVRQHRGVPVLASRGVFVGGSSLPWDQSKQKKGERHGHHWRIVPVPERGAFCAVINVNYWKSFVQARLAETMGDPGCFSLFGENPKVHRMVADHLTGEYRVTVEGRGRKVDEWKPHPARDNHWLDCLVGCAAAASMLGVDLFAKPSPAKKRKKKRKAGHVSKL